MVSVTRDDMWVVDSLGGASELSVPRTLGSRGERRGWEGGLMKNANVSRSRWSVDLR